MRFASICSGARTPSLTGSDGGVCPVAKGSQIVHSGSGESNFKRGLICRVRTSGTSMSPWCAKGTWLSLTVSGNTCCEVPKRKDSVDL